MPFREMAPHFLIIGAMKSGTTALYRHLLRHPEIGGATEKELHYFDWNFSRNLAWYRAQFPKGSSLICGEASPFYLYHPWVPERIAATLPEVRLIAILRDPIARAISHYHHSRRLGREPLQMAEAFGAERSRLQGLQTAADYDAFGPRSGHVWHSYVARGLYREQLERYVAIFGDRLFVLVSEEVFGPRRNLAALYGFLGVDPLRVPDETFAPANVGSTEARPRELEEALAETFLPHTRALSRFLGRRLPWPGGRDA